MRLLNNYHNINTICDKNVQQAKQVEEKKQFILNVCSRSIMYKLYKKIYIIEKKENSCCDNEAF